MPRPTLVRIGDEVFDVVAESPAGSLFLLNRKGLQLRRIEQLEARMVAAREELARLEREATAAEVLDSVADEESVLPGARTHATATIDADRTTLHPPQADATGTP